MKKLAMHYNQAVKTTKLDDQISEDEFHNLIIIRNQILNESMNFESGSRDIKKLIKVLFKMINEYELSGMGDNEKIEDEP